MRRLIHELRENCEEFIWQPDDHVLLVSSADADIAYVLKVIEQIEGGDESSLYLMLADPYADADSYAQTIAQRCVEIYAIVNEQRLAHGEDPLPAFPDRLTAARVDPRERIVIAIEHLGQRLPNPDEHRVVIALLPLAVHDWNDYLRFVASFAQLPEPAPQLDEAWPAYARILMRDDREQSLGRQLDQHGATGVLTFAVDMSTEAAAQAMAADAVDPAVPIAERMQAFLQLANVDLSYQRYDEAERKFVVLHDYYVQTDAKLMQALCLHGAGDCKRMSGDLPAALERYQQSLATTLAAESPTPTTPDDPAGSAHPNAPPVLLNSLLAAAGTCMTLQAFADARSYFEDASKVAAKCVNAYAACDALEGQGDAHRAMHEYVPALEAWRSCETIAESYTYADRLVSVRERILALYVESNHQAEAEHAQVQLDAARQLQQQQQQGAA